MHALNRGTDFDGRAGYQTCAPVPSFARAVRSMSALAVTSFQGPDRTRAASAATPPAAQTAACANSSGVAMLGRQYTSCGNTSVTVFARSHVHACCYYAQDDGAKTLRVLRVPLTFRLLQCCFKFLPFLRHSTTWAIVLQLLYWHEPNRALAWLRALSWTMESSASAAAAASGASAPPASRATNGSIAPAALQNGRI